MDKYSILKEKFGYNSFRDGQEEIIDGVMDVSKIGVLTVAPTSFGKSLCFQIPALLFGGLNIVISPLISLMQDQVKALKAKGIQAEFYNSTLSEPEKEAVINQLQLGTIELLYVAPERFEDTAFVNILERCNVSLFAVDEAHCVSQYGDFRPSYRKIRRAIEAVNPKQVVALTATATKRTQQDISAQLGFTSPRKFIKGFYRDNLHIEIVQCANGTIFDSIIEDLEEHHRKGETTGIVYTNTRKDAEALGAILNGDDYGIKSLIYHGGMKDEERKQILDEWLKNGGNIIATNSLGMGVDVPNIRYILLAGMTGSIEDFAQQIGRAGRDGNISSCIMYVNMKKDLWLQNFFINTTCPPSYTVKKFWEWINDAAKKKSKIEMTQEKMEYLSGIEKGTVGGCMGVLKAAGLVDSIEKGVYEVNHFDNPDEAPINYQFLEQKRKIKTDKLDEMKKYVNNDRKCRQLMMLDYFDDTSRIEPCHNCDICKRNNKRK
jgi:ATP-dependent DNA helicase RecQ